MILEAEEAYNKNKNYNYYPQRVQMSSDIISINLKKNRMLQKIKIKRIPRY
jgi:hypothetical protein